MNTTSAMAGAPSAERDEMLEWAGDDYDPARFDLASAAQSAAQISGVDAHAEGTIDGERL